ncbi:MAG: PQQ-binding-like beta-propeller repeat protein [Dactylosporangium sp.]|nr:PQQ-like beta-propeller repeat protein [Dactylosporangium sp.]NNJ62671.1 PQQ-binding-like beta-propeller repeat protein [Dactylosporangium sp.]
MIELDISAAWEPPPPSRRVLNRRWIAPVVVLLLALGGFAADGRSVRFDAILELPGDTRQLAIDRDGILFVQSSDVEIASLEAYGLPEGRRLWAHPVGAVRQDLLRHRGMLVVTTYDDDHRAVVLRGIDGRTGRPIWTRPGMTVLRAAGRLLVLIEPLSTAGGSVIMSDAVGPTADRRVEAVDVRTGVTAWTSLLPAGSSWRVTSEELEGRAGAPGGPALVVFGPDGAIRVLDLATGLVTATADLGRSPTNRYLVAQPDSIVVLWSPGGDRSTFQAYDLSSGQPTWAVDGGATGFVVPCGWLVCLSSESSMAVLDLATGAVARTLPTAVNGFLVGNRFVTFGDPQPRVVVRDLSTGQDVRLLRGWSVSGTFTDGRLVVTRPDATPGRALLATLDSLTGQLTLLGGVRDDARDLRCQGAGAYLACVGASAIRVWQIDAAALA